MKKSIVSSILLALLLIAVLPIAVLADDGNNGKGKGTGFDEYGYNKQAGIFNGEADGVDKNLNNAVWGDPTYANDHLVMRWSDAWQDAKNGAVWTTSAWENNNWNGMGKDGSGETWHYKIVWIGGSGPEGEMLPDGGYRIWGQFEVIMSHGTGPDGHIWDVRADSAGYGQNK